MSNYTFKNVPGTQKNLAVVQKNVFFGKTLHIKNINGTKKCCSEKLCRFMEKCCGFTEKCWFMAKCCRYAEKYDSFVENDAGTQEKCRKLMQEYTIQYTT